MNRPNYQCAAPGCQYVTTNKFCTMHEGAIPTVIQDDVDTDEVPHILTLEPYPKVSNAPAAVAGEIIGERDCCARGQSEAKEWQAHFRCRCGRRWVRSRAAWTVF